MKRTAGRGHGAVGPLPMISTLREAGGTDMIDHDAPPVKQAQGKLGGTHVRLRATN